MSNMLRKYDEHLTYLKSTGWVFMYSPRARSNTLESFWLWSWSTLIACFIAASGVSLLRVCTLITILSSKGWGIYEEINSSTNMHILYSQRKQHSGSYSVCAVRRDPLYDLQAKSWKYQSSPALSLFHNEFFSHHRVSVHPFLEGRRVPRRLFGFLEERIRYIPGLFSLNKLCIERFHYEFFDVANCNECEYSF